MKYNNLDITWPDVIWFYHLYVLERRLEVLVVFDASPQDSITHCFLLLPMIRHNSHRSFIFSDFEPSVFQRWSNVWGHRFKPHQGLFFGLGRQPRKANLQKGLAARLEGSTNLYATWHIIYVSFMDFCTSEGHVTTKCWKLSFCFFAGWNTSKLTLSVSTGRNLDGLTQSTDNMWQRLAILLTIFDIVSPHVTLSFTIDLLFFNHNVFFNHVFTVHMSFYIVSFSGDSSDLFLGRSRWSHL